MKILLRFLKDPLAHFLIAGFALFVIYSLVNPNTGVSEDPKRIVVDRDVMLTFIQYQTKVFQRELAAKYLDALSKEDLQKMIDGYVREEALFRESTALGLGSNDYIIKLRMIQKIDFISQGFAEAAVEVSDEEIKAYYDANREKFRQEAIITFTQVFFDAERWPVDQLDDLARKKLAELREANTQFSDAPKHGNRFPYGVNYVERTPDHVESQFGKSMTEALFKLEPDDSKWHGPFVSPYGIHLAMVVNKKNAEYLPLDAARSRVVDDLTREKIREQSNKAIAAIVDTYEVDTLLDTKPERVQSGQE
jgi:parvulin-like peptidyl-prolyl isomerase